MFFILYRSKCFSNTLQDNKRSRRAKGEAAARKGSVQALQTEPSLVKVSEPLCTFSFHTSGTNALRRESLCHRLPSGFLAVAARTPVMCVMMKTRTTPWNWPPG